MATGIDKINRQLEGIEEELEAIKESLKARGISDEKEIALRNDRAALLTKEASLKAEKRELEGSAPSGNPINLSQSLHKVFECVIVVLFPLFCRGHLHPPPHTN
jgi:hypothetical protein